jgi:L-cysteine desulfidase
MCIVLRNIFSQPQIFYFSEFCDCLPTAIGVATHLNYNDHHGSHNVIVLENLLEILRKS